MTTGLFLIVSRPEDSNDKLLSFQAWSDHITWYWWACVLASVGMPIHSMSLQDFFNQSSLLRKTSRHATLCILPCLFSVAGGKIFHQFGEFLARIGWFQAVQSLRREAYLK